MPVDFSLPPLDDPATAVLVERYFQPVGAHVTPGQPLALVVTERFEWEIPATTAGTITTIVAEPGTTVAPGALLLELSPPEEATSTTSEPQAEQQPTAMYRATPLARRMAAAHGLDLAAVAGSGHSGRITRNDVLCMIGHDQPKPSIGTGTNGSVTTQPADLSSLVVAAPPTAPAKTETPVPSSALATPPTPTTASRWRSAHSDLPHAITAINIDMTAIQTYIDQHAARAAKRGIILNGLACLAHGVVTILGQHRLLNSAWTDDGIILWSRIHLGLIDRRNPNPTPLIIPNASDLNVHGIARRLTYPAAETGIGTAPTFTVATLPTSWWSGTVPTTASAAALTFSATESRPVVLEQAGIDTITLRPCSLATLTYDARIVDQLQSDTFLRDLKQRLEHFGGL